MDINKLLANALDTYYTSLSSIGSMPNREVNKLVLLDFLAEVLSDDYDEIFTEEEFRILTSAVDCIVGSHCMFKFENYQEAKAINKVNTNLTVRITEDNLLRFTTDNNLRIIL